MLITYAIYPNLVDIRRTIRHSHGIEFNCWQGIRKSISLVFRHFCVWSGGYANVGVAGL